MFGLADFTTKTTFYNLHNFLHLLTSLFSFIAKFFFQESKLLDPVSWWENDPDIKHLQKQQKVSIIPVFLEHINDFSILIFK